MITSSAFIQPGVSTVAPMVSVIQQPPVVMPANLYLCTTAKNATGTICTICSVQVANFALYMHHKVKTCCLVGSSHVGCAGGKHERMEGLGFM